MKLNTILFLITLILTSCNFRTYNKSYVPSGPHVADFQTNQSNLKTFMGFTDSEIQYAKPINEKYGISINGFWGYTGQYIGEAGFVWYRKNEKRYFELNTGLGYSRIRSVLDDIPDALLYIPHLAVDNYYSHNISADYLKLYIQPSYLFNFSHYVRMGPTLKLASILYLNYDYSYKLDSWGGSGYEGIRETDKVSFNNKAGINIEPVWNIKLGSGRNRFLFQIGGSFTSTVMESTTLQQAFYWSSKIPKTFRHPKQRHLIMNLGYEFRF